MKKRFFNWLLSGFLIDFIEAERTFQFHIIAGGHTIAIQNMYVVPQIGTKVEVKERLFLVKDIIYSPYGSANKLIGKFID